MSRHLRYSDGFCTSQPEVGVAYTEGTAISAAIAHNKKVRADRSAAGKRGADAARLRRDSYLTLRSFK